MRTYTRCVVVGALVLGGWYYASPYYGLYRMRELTPAGKGDQFSTYVDVPAVRESVKS